MTDLTDFLAKLESDVAVNRRASATTCSLVGQLSVPVRVALGPVLAWVGCNVDVVGGGELPLFNDLQRERIGRIILCRFAVDTPEPVWSSKTLTDAVDAFLVIPGARIGDLLAAMVQIWRKNDTPLTSSVANFAKDVALLCYTAYRSSYRDSDLDWLANEMERRPSQPTAYLALRTLPVDQVERVRQPILDALRGTSLADEARALLDD